MQSAGEICALRFLIDRPLELWRSVFNLKVVSNAGQSREVEIYCNGELVATEAVNCNKLGSLVIQSAMPINSSVTMELKLREALPDESVTLRYFSIDKVQ